MGYFYTEKAFLNRWVLRDFFFFFFKDERMSELRMWDGIKFQTVGAKSLKERWPKDLVFVLGTEMSLSSFDLSEQEASLVVRSDDK